MEEENTTSRPLVAGAAVTRSRRDVVPSACEPCRRAKVKVLLTSFAKDQTLIMISVILFALRAAAVSVAGLIVHMMLRPALPGQWRLNRDMTH